MNDTIRVEATCLKQGDFIVKLHSSWVNTDIECQGIICGIDIPAHDFHSVFVKILGSSISEFYLNKKTLVEIVRRS